MSKLHLEVDCTKRCRSRRHGQTLINAITKRSVSDEALASFIKGTCTNFNQAFDFEGRTALHMSASRGRRHLMEWLVRNSSEAFINAKDRESGYTPLHRSIFYGQIHTAVALMKLGVNMDIVDKDDYKALEHAMLDRQYMYKHDGTEPCDVYVWGSNSNYTLGTGAQQQKKIPDLLNCFSRTNTSVKQICLGKFHSVWLCSSGHNEGEVWACGQLARAGAPPGTALRPAPLRLPEPCVQAAVTLNSTVLLLQSGNLIQYSLHNTDSSLSQSNARTPATIRLPYAKPLLKLSEPIGVCASRVHAVVWNVRAAYTWGTNLGQLGHSQPTDKYIDAPKRVSVSINNKEESGLQLAAASDAATVLTTSRGDVYLLHKHICKKIAIKQINLKQVCVDGKVSEQGAYSRVTVLLLTNVGQLLIWQDTTNRLTRCIFGLNHQTVITHMTLTHDSIFFTTKYGEAFVGTVSRKTQPSAPQPFRKERAADNNNKSSLVKFLEKDDCTPVKIVKIPNVHRAVSIAVDAEGLNFACLQINPTCGLRSLPELSVSSLPKHMESLLQTATEDDILHDVVFKVGKKLFPAHIFIVATGSEYLYKLYQDKLLNGEEKPTIILENVHPEAFERILKYLYTGSCDVMEIGPCSLKIRKEDMINIKKDKENFDNEFELIENPLEVSAFEVYKEQKEKGKKKHRQRPSVEPSRVHQYCDPVKLVQAAAKRTQVMSLHKALDKFYFKDGKVCLKQSASLQGDAGLGWDRDGFPELADTIVCTKDGVHISAQKCVLAARLEYFNGMFMHSWTESKMKSTVTLPVNHGILLPIINFLYTDRCLDIENSDSIDFICNLLIVADQLFITRLREMCEVALANLVTLKNCTELCQFAHTYNATQLKQCCMEFISLNIGGLLENRSLEILENDLLEDLSCYYCKFNPIMSSRIITPFFNATNDDFINEMNQLYPVDLDSVDEELKTEPVEGPKKKNKSSKKIEYTESEKARMRYESVSSVNSLDLSNGDITLSLSNISKDDKEVVTQDKWIEVPTSQQKQQKVVLARLKAINNAKDILNEIPTESFTRLTKHNSFGASSPPERGAPTTSRMSASVMNHESHSPDIAKSPQGNLIISHVGPKMSQKQRKKLAMQTDTTSSQSLDDSFTSKLSMGSPPSAAPRNPWKMSEVPTVLGAGNSPKSLEFNQILADQKKQKDDSSRIMTKPLNLTQLEDKAIEELERFYNIHEVDDELITIRRIELQVSSPQWIHTTPK